MIKTFRGQLADGGQDRIRLQTNDGKTGYRIVKLEVIDGAPGVVNIESVVKIYKESQSSVTGTVDFNDSALVGMAFWVFNHSNPSYSTTSAVIFDKEIFNQDIYITNKDVSGSANGANYYLELEVIPLTDQAAEYTTIKDIRSNA